MPTLTETLHEQCRALITQRGMFTEDLLAALRLIAGRSDGMLSELMAGYGGLQQLLLTGLPFVQWDFSSGVFPTAGMTFTRAGDRSATVVDHNNIVWFSRANELRLQGLRRVENLIPQSENLSDPSWGSPGDTSGFLGTGSAAVVTPNFGVAPDGTLTASRLQLNLNAGAVAAAAANRSGLRYAVAAAPANVSTGSIVRCSFYVKPLDTWTASEIVAKLGTASPDGCLFFGLLAGGAFSDLTAEDVGDGWVRISVTASIVSAIPWTFRFQLVSNTANTRATVDWLVWGVQMEAQVLLGVTSEYVSNGVLSSPFHGAFADGVKYFPTNEVGDPISDAVRLGLLVEAAATNLLLRSEAYENASWVKTDTVITPDSFGAPSLIGVADLLTEGVAGTGRCSQDFVIAAGQTATHSVFLRRGNHDWVRVAIYDSTAAAGVEAYFNLALGTVGSAVNVGVGTGATATIQAFGNGWYRCSIAGAVNGGFTTCTAHTFSATANADPTRVNNGQRYQWGSQAEIRGFPTSYVQTAGATVTRPTDLPEVTVAGRLMPFTLFADASSPFNSATLRWSVAFNTGGGSFTSLARVRTAPSTVTNAIGEVWTGGVAQASIALPIGGAPRVKTAFAVAENDTAFSLNGGAPVVDGSVAPWTVPATSLKMGFFPGEPLNGTLKTVRLYPSRLPDATLQSLTA